MIKKQQRVLCRASFVLLCLLPTFVHVWSLFTSGDSPEKINEPGSKQLGPGQVASNEKETDRKQKDQPISKGLIWAREQGLDLEKLELLEHHEIQKSDLPPTHWLRRFSSPTVKISESRTAIVLAFPELTIGQFALRNLMAEFVGGEFKSVLPGQGKLIVKIEVLTLLRFGDSRSTWEQMRDVEIQLSGDSVIASGRRLPESVHTKLQPEYPFRFSLTWDQSKTTLEFSGMSFPVWMLGNGYHEIVGETAEITGKLRSVQYPNRSPSVRFTGTIVNVSSERLSTWLNPSQTPLVTGTCQVQCDKFLTDEKRVREFAGEIKSIQAGTVDPVLAQIIGDQVQWLPTSHATIEYRSFLFLVDYANERLGIKSMFDGNPLVWTNEGSIMVAK